MPAPRISWNDPGDVYPTVQNAMADILDDHEARLEEVEENDLSSLGEVFARKGTTETISGQWNFAQAPTVGGEPIDAGGSPVQSVNGQTGEVILNAASVGADPAGSAQNVQNSVDSLVPTGTVVLTLADVAPTGWVFARGQTLSRTGNGAGLFALFGTKYGAGNGSTTFNVPDARKLFVAGADPAGGGYALGDTGGEAAVTLTTAQLPSHSHSGPSHSHSIGNHSHSVNSHTHASGNLATANAGSHTHGVGTYQFVLIGGSGGSGAAFSNGGVNLNAVGSSGIHTHNITGSTAGAGANTSAAGSGNTGASGTGNTGNAGSGQAHPNIPPYMALNFLIKL